MGVQTLRQQKIAENLANIDTAGYHSKRVEFEEFLSKNRSLSNLKCSNPRHIRMNYKDIDPEVVDSGKETELHEEMSEMAKVQLLYALETSSLSRRFKMLREAIAGRIT